jgi:hypothetical protein
MLPGSLSTADPWLSNVMAGVLANAVTGTLAQLGRLGQKAAARREKLRELLESKSNLKAGLQKAICSRAALVQLGSDGGPADIIRAFLVSAEAEGTVRQILATRLVVDSGGITLDDAREQFRAALLHRVPTIATGIADDLFDSLLLGCDHALSLAVDEGVLAAHEAKSAFRHRALIGELAAIKECLGLLTSGAVDLLAIDEFEKAYRSQVAERYGSISPPHLDKFKRFPIDDLYVTPDLSRRYKKHKKTLSEDVFGETSRESLSDFMAVMNRAVLLGTWCR